MPEYETPDYSVHPTFEDDDYEECYCGYKPDSRQDLENHIGAASRIDDGKDHG